MSVLPQYCVSTVSTAVVRDCTLPAPRIPTSVIQKAITHVQIANFTKRCAGMSNYTTNHSATKSHVAELAEGLAIQSLGVPIGGVEVGGHSKNLHNPVSHHLADTHEAHVDMASATRAGGRVGDEAASLVVRVHFR